MRLGDVDRQELEITTVRVPTDVLSALKQIAMREERTVSEIIRRMLQLGVKKDAGRKR